MPQKGWQADQGTEGLLLKSCRDISEGKRLHNQITRQLPHDRYLGNLLIQMYGKCADPTSALFVFQCIQHRNLFSWSLLITALAQNGSILECKFLLEKMPQRDLVVLNTVAVAYAQTGYFDLCKNLFDSMPQRDLIAWTALFRAYSLRGYLQSAEYIYLKVPSYDVMFSNAMLVAYAHFGHIDMARDADEIFQSMPEKNVVSWNSLVTALHRRGNLEQAETTFESMAEKTISSWNSMITGYASNGELEEAMKIFHSMPRRNAISWNSLLAACARDTKCSSDEAEKLFHGMPGRTMVSFNTMIAVFSQNGNLDLARKAFDDVPEKNLISWTVLSAGFAQHGRADNAMNLFKQMDVEGLEPDEICFLTVFLACSHAGKLSESFLFFLAMVDDYQLLPIAEHYFCLIDVLARNGRLDEAEDLIQSLPNRENNVQWMTLLGACKTQIDIGRANRAAGLVINYAPKVSSAGYILLSQVYALTGISLGVNSK
ncbi:pentatricopeptide repeat-containing protein At2g35030, mitochondrial-like [Selaginella moellendorffii]|uniref:pentatricopeptide repeat-containing protein At2g35030, mitochondrial-like n=1 Tax=Selaginella moellendorffii TaxID=88036 RepID=UPI000D1D0C0B|nr:pentatricopeptide repeat-containing protein At2g35030, mitochondrial-like [Selaginella moellendorffii]|eukprot:XP_024523976.1 pentatricopeptide repeat-containing protein At2g35030, mitochondrial-like [Selaginella moellendorffii]